MARQMIPRTLFMLLFSVLFVFLSWGPWSTLATFSFHNESSNHVLLIPCVSIFLLIVERKHIFKRVGAGTWLGIPIIFLGSLGYWYARVHGASLNPTDALSATISALLVFWAGGFTVCYGAQVLRAGMFPILFLFLMVPIPSAFLAMLILLLQKGSADVAYNLFNFLGVPVYREGFLLSLPGITIEVAQECSGIRSSIALFITTLLAGQLFLHTAWRKALFCSAIVPLVFIKNGIRIVTLSLLGVYVDRSFLFGNLHREGGVVFFLLALLILAPILWLLQRLEGRGQKREAGLSATAEHAIGL